MDLPRARAALPKLLWLDSVPSTNQALRDLVAAQPNLPHGTVLATANQVAGRGRLGREWQTPSGTALAASFLIRSVSLEAASVGAAEPGGLGLSWLPLLAGSAVAFAVRAELPTAHIAVKWPNDVHVFDLTAEGRAGIARGIGRKVSGILCELLPGYTDGRGDVIVGFGINLLVSKAQLPTPTATSLLVEGGRHSQAASVVEAGGAQLLDRVLATTGAELLRLVALSSNTPVAARARVEADSATLGANVRAFLPSGEIVTGTASSLTGDGALVIVREGRPGVTVSAGDVEHLR